MDNDPQQPPTARIATAPPRRRGTSWWAWLLAGCAGCAVVFAIIAVIGIVFFGKAVGGFAQNVQRTEVGEVTEARIQAELGEVPLYANGQFDVALTTNMLKVMKATPLLFKAQGDPITTAIVITTDSPDTVLKWYDQQLAGWQRQQRNSVGQFSAIASYTQDDRIVQVQGTAQGNGNTQVTVTLFKRRASSGTQP